MYKNILIFVLMLIASSLSIPAYSKWVSYEPNTVTLTETLQQEMRTGEIGKARFFMIEGSIVYITESSSAKSICQKYPDVTDSSPIEVEGINIPATSFCSGNNIATYIEGEAGKWVMARLWKQNSVVIDGWEVSAEGFQNAVRSSVQ
ncbi:hypothetical protein [Vibrio comitans]|uniref:Uncharacterized protein n=1 Tax=Vibrio comitans NBRC 102076 TaxID=1219078 RepID=A0A4Y3IU19_9VIBR|nr:hypothetical protein [Vibrio comitans]GEA62278.1 hypothetical protein VCO01S_34710 [Vibrio comitans NBRC 102076]